MSELKDPKIKLFGKTIELPENSSLAAAAVDESSEPGSAQSYEHAVGDGSNHDPPCSSDSMVEDRHLMSEDAEEEESVKPPSSSHEKHHPKEDDENPTGPPNPDEPKDHKPVVSIASPKPEEAQTETAGSPNEKALKKPDKILHCPRCNSMDTKFCYFNNYNVNQPRHFCKNCQRYWTAGGTMRNVPVGAGRRKNKSSSTATTHFRHLAVHPEILAFGGPDSPLCDSIASSLSIADQTGRAGSRNRPIRSEPNSGVPPPPPPPPPPPLPPQVPCYPGPAQLAYTPWGPVGWGPSGGGFPMPFYPTTPPSYWGWSVPCFVPMVGSGAGPNSPTLGKHSREGETAVAVAAKESDPKKCLWVPKTLRIDDPSEAAKSSIWAMLGLQNKGGSDSGKGGLFKAFGTESRGDGKAHVLEASTVLQANPAALSRALSFHESS